MTHVFHIKISVNTLIGLAMVLVAGCSQNDGARFLNFDVSQAASDAPWPRLEPLSEIAQARGTDSAALNSIENLDTRANALRVRAAQLRASILSAADRERLAQLP